MSEAIQVYLASTSPRRKLLLRQLQVNFHCLNIDVDEACISNETANDYVVRMAVSKALAGWHHHDRKHDLPVIGADTTIEMTGEIIGKPESAKHAIQILQSLSGNTHRVITAVSVLNGRKKLSAVNRTEVSFRKLSDAEIINYVHTGEPLDKAGAYAIQGLGAIFVNHLAGSYTGVMGLPLFETSELLESMAVNII